MTLWLKRVMKHLGRGKHPLFDRAVELMAGTGRNLPTLAPHCRHIDAIEQIPKFTHAYPKSIKSTTIAAVVVQVQDFKWTPSYDLIVGIWCLSYLNEGDI